MLSAFKRLLALGGVIFAFFAVAAYFQQPQIYEALNVSLQDWKRWLFLEKPCQEPLTYRLGVFDGRFRIEKSEFLRAVSEAEAMWETAAGRDLFQESEFGAIQIGLAYDWRQEATDKLQALGLDIKQDRNSYELLKAKYEELYRNYTGAKSRLATAIADYERRKEAYEKEVASWNDSGGAPEEEYERLGKEQQALNQEAASLQSRQRALNESVADLNAVVDSLNLLAESLNLEVAKYNNIGASHGTEFEAGVYTSDSSGVSITIYAFGSRAELVRSLAHELGHALGLPHIDDPAAIMYRLNQSFNEAITPADLLALQTVCSKPE